MRIEAVEAIAVGPLADQELTLGPGLTVIHGPNEAGKSSWHAALVAGWLGLRRAPGRHRAEDRAFVERFAPWSGAPLIAAVRVVTDDGARYRFRHNLTDLADHEVTDGTNTVVTGRFEHDGTADGARLLGLTRELVHPTLCVSQADVLGVTEAAEGLQTALQRAAASTNRDGGTAAAALQRLEDFRRERVGTDRANATKPLRRALDRVAEARAALADAEQEHARHRELLARRDTARRERDRLAARREVLVRGLRAAEAAERRAELARLRELDAVVTAARDEPAPASEELRAEVAGVRQRYAERPEPAPEDDEVAALEAELEALPTMPDGDTDVAAAVADAHEELRVRRDRLAYHEQHRPAPVDAPDLGGLRPEDLDRHATTLETPPLPIGAHEPTPEDGNGGPTALLAAGVLAGAGGVGALLAGAVVVGGAVLVLAALLLVGWWALRRRRHASGAETAVAAARRAEHEQLTARREAARAALATAGLPDDPGALRTLADRARDAEHDLRAHASWEADEARIRGAITDEERRLTDALTARDVPTDADLDAAVAGYRDACRHRRDQAAAAARRPDLERRLAVARELAATHRERNQARQRAAEELIALARRLGHDARDDDPVAADGFLSSWLDAQAELRERRAEARRAADALTARLAGRTLAECAEEAARLADAAGDVTPASDPDAARGELAGLDEDLDRARAEAGRLDGEVANAERHATPVPDVREELERAQAELARVEALREVLAATARHLEDASRRVNQDIAPVLRETLAASLPDVTDGRYADVRVNPRQLQVTVRTDGGVYRPAEHLSQGTTEQIYLLLRIGLAEHLVVTDETAPLLLDDVCVQFDEHRTVAFLELARRLAADRQIVLFSQEREVLEWAEARLDGERHRLHRLAAPAPAASAPRTASPLAG